MGYFRWVKGVSKCTMKNIVLVGFMGSGKSVVGRRLAKEFSFEFIDTDQWIEEKSGKTISEIFSEEGGERRFRELESEVIFEVAQRERSVISTGGGAVISPSNRTTLCEKGILVWLKARPDLILKRAQKRPGERPLLRGSDPLGEIKRLLEEREPYYRSATFSIDTSDRTVFQVVSQIKKRILEIAGQEDPSLLGRSGI